MQEQEGMLRLRAETELRGGGLEGYEGVLWEFLALKGLRLIRDIT